MAEKDFACKVCQNTPDADGILSHGKGCYMVSEDGGGDEYIPDADLWDWCVCGHHRLSHEGHTCVPGYPVETHCSRGCGCKAFEQKGKR